MLISDEDSLSEIALSGASKLASTYLTLFYRSVLVFLHLHRFCIYILISSVLVLLFEHLIDRGGCHV